MNSRQNIKRNNYAQIKKQREFLQPFTKNRSSKNIVKNKLNSASNSMIFALASSQLGVSSFTINLILITSVTILLGLPTLFLFRLGQGKSAF